MSNNPLDFVSGIIRQYSPCLRRIIVKYIFIHAGWRSSGNDICGFYRDVHLVAKNVAIVWLRLCSKFLYLSILPGGTFGRASVTKSVRFFTFNSSIAMVPGNIAVEKKRIKLESRLNAKGYINVSVRLSFVSSLDKTEKV